MHTADPAPEQGGASFNTHRMLFGGSGVCSPPQEAVLHTFRSKGTHEVRAELGGE